MRSSTGRDKSGGFAQPRKRFPRGLQTRFASLRGDGSEGPCGLLPSFTKGLGSGLLRSCGCSWLMRETAVSWETSSAPFSSDPGWK